METKLTKRTVTKFIAKLLVQTSVGAAVAKSMQKAIPATENYKVSEMTGAVAAYYAGEKLEPVTDELVDVFWDEFEARQAARKTT